MTFSKLMDNVNSKGPFQFLVTVLLGIPILGMANHNLLQIFTAATPAHHCRPAPNASAGPWLLPMGLNGKPEPCLRFAYPPNASLTNDTQGDTEPCLDGWVYNISTGNSIVTEWDLVCDSNKLKEMAQSVFMAGILIGGIVLGDLSDRFGRKPILSFSYLMLAASGSGAAFSPTLPTYMALRFLCGFSISGVSLSTVILNVEWVSTRMRAITSTTIGYFYTFGQFILPGLAYGIPRWRWLQLTVSIPYFAFFLLSWWVPESIRWMVLSGKSSKALKILQWVAIFNGKKEEGEKLSLEDLRLNLQTEMSLAKAKYSVADLFRIPILRRVTFCLSLAWFATGFAYYSLAMGVEEFGFNLYLLQLVFGGVDIPAKFITILSISYLGRHITEATTLLLAGGSILALIFVPSDLQTLRTVLAVFGKGCLSSSFACLFLYTSELYPTVIRQTGMGITNLLTRVGSMTAPLVRITGEMHPFIPNVIFGTTALLGGSAAFFLPETLNRPLPETIQDMENWSPQAKEPKLESEAEKATQRIPLQPCGLDLRPS
ncbi:solute carrier family 22 member 8 [Rhinolophus ferrumequinum]|uniref:Solute carrier family 22 member 8 n=1 Tax=Rhinolophus ferrumequinum TaxID=59479 RepID=A0A671ETH8_RHIFE|nr:organic anion transporter 3 isoform X2 [Rhinolophus ferrumequinum]KAF6334288.1 solute carrier family 22 member 8 [Rhinolophus ferrumequinum]